VKSCSIFGICCGLLLYANQYRHTFGLSPSGTEPWDLSDVYRVWHFPCQNCLCHKNNHVLSFDKQA